MKTIKLKSIEDFPHTNVAARIGKAMLKEHGFYRAVFDGVVIRYVLQAA